MINQIIKLIAAAVFAGNVIGALELSTDKSFFLAGTVTIFMVADFYQHREDD